MVTREHNVIISYWFPHLQRPRMYLCASCSVPDVQTRPIGEFCPSFIYSICTLHIQMQILQKTQCKVVKWKYKLNAVIKFKEGHHINYTLVWQRAEKSYRYSQGAELPMMCAAIQSLLFYISFHLCQELPQFIFVLLLAGFVAFTDSWAESQLIRKTTTAKITQRWRELNQQKFDLILFHPEWTLVYGNVREGKIYLK